MSRINELKSKIIGGGLITREETLSLADEPLEQLCARELGVKSVPVNMLNPIPNTPLEHNKILTEEEMSQIVAIFRFIIPDGQIRLAGGRGLLSDMGKRLFQSGANAAISGEMLTTRGITIDNDMKMTRGLGYALLYTNPR